MLQWQYQKDMMLDSLLFKSEREKLIDEIADEVISRFHIKVDTTDIIQAIEELDKQINKLGGK